MNKFEDFLREIHAKDYTGTDDDMVDAFEEWLTVLDYEKYLEYGEMYGKFIHQQILEVVRGMIPQVGALDHKEYKKAIDQMHEKLKGVER